MKIIIYCILLIFGPIPLKSNESNFTATQNYLIPDNSKSVDYAMNFKTKLYSYETVNELIHDSDAPAETQLMNVTKASVSQNTPIANSVFLPVLSMLAGLLLWRFHGQNLQKKQSKVKEYSK
jgi:hypothetical protein